MAGYTAGTLFALLPTASLILVKVSSEVEMEWSKFFALGVFALDVVVAPVLARGIALVVDAAD